MKNMNIATESTVNPIAPAATESVPAIVSPTANDSTESTERMDGVIYDVTPFGAALSNMYHAGNKKMMGATTLKETAGMSLSEYKVYMADLQTAAIAFDRVKDAYNRAAKRTAAMTNALKAARTPVYEYINAIAVKAGCFADASDADFAAKIARDLLSTKATDNGDGTVSGGEKKFDTTKQAKFIKAIEWLIGAKLNGMVWDGECSAPMTPEQRAKVEARIAKEKERAKKAAEKAKADAAKAGGKAKRDAEKQARKEVRAEKKAAEKAESTAA